MSYNLKSLFCGCGGINLCSPLGNITHKEDYKKFAQYGESLFVLHSIETPIRGLMGMICKAATFGTAFRFSIPQMENNSVLVYAARPLDPMETKEGEQQPQGAQIINRTLATGKPLGMALKKIEKEITKHKAKIILIDNLFRYVSGTPAKGIAEGISKLAEESGTIIIAGFFVCEDETNLRGIVEFHNSFYRHIARIRTEEENGTAYYILEYPKADTEEIIFGADPSGIPCALPGLSERLVMRQAMPVLAKEQEPARTLVNRLYGYYKGSKALATCENQIHKAAENGELSKTGKGKYMKYQYSEKYNPFTFGNKEAQPNIITALTDAKKQGRKKRVPFITPGDTKILIWEKYCGYVAKDIAVSIIEAVLCGHSLDFRGTFVDPRICIYCIGMDPEDIEGIEEATAKAKEGSNSAVSIVSLEPSTIEDICGMIEKDIKKKKPNFVGIFCLDGITDVEKHRTKLNEILFDMSKANNIACIATDKMVGSGYYYYRQHPENICFVRMLLEDIDTRKGYFDICELSSESNGNYISCKFLEGERPTNLQKGEMDFVYLEKTFSRYQGKGFFRKNILDVFGKPVNRAVMKRAKEFGIIVKRGYYYYYVPKDRR